MFPHVVCNMSQNLLIDIVHNDFHSTHGIFRLFDGLEVKNMDDPAAVTKPVINGVHANGMGELNGSFKTNETVFNEVNK
jgi:methylenetetrahydrofolate reductase (NADPH)